MGFIIRYALFSLLTYAAGSIYINRGKHEKLLLTLYFAASASIFLIG